MSLSRETLHRSVPLNTREGITHIRSFDTHPNLLIRTNEKVATDEHILKDYSREQKVLLDDIKRYGINVPTYFSTHSSLYTDVGTSLYPQATHTFIRRVTPTTLEDIPVNSQDDIVFRNEVRATYIKLTSYCMNAYKDNKPVLSDIFTLDQWIYGKTRLDTKDKLYLIDIENISATFGKEGHIKNLETFADESMRNYGVDVSDLEDIALNTFSYLV